MKLLIAALVFTNLAYAHTEFKGNLKGSSVPCSLHIEQTYYADQIEKPENFRADVVAFLEDSHHGGHGEELHFTVKLGGKPNLFSGLGSNQKDQINVVTKAGTSSLNSIDLYSVKWLHINHFHSAQCVNLKRAE